MALGFQKISKGINLAAAGLTSDPSGSAKGDIYFNVSTNKLRIYEGTSWADTATGASAANQALSNLTSPTAINQDLLSGTQYGISVGSVGHEINQLFTKQARVVNTSSLIPNLIANTPAIVLNGATSEAQAAGGASIVFDGDNATGELVIATKEQVGANGTAAVLIASGANTVTGNSGDVTLQTGLAAGTSGDVVLQTGSGATKGKILLAGSFIDANNTKISNVTDPTSAQDAATKNYTDATFANKALSNLASVAINTSLLAGTDNTIDLGSNTLRWRTGYVGNLKDASSNLIIDLTNRILKNSAGGSMLDWSTAGTLNASTNRITNVVDPTSAQDAATKAYVDNVSAGLDPKQSSRVATTADLGATYNASGGTAGTGAFTGAPTVIDGITLNTGDRVLVKDQSDAKQNGIYSVISSGAWNRSSDMDGTPANEVSGGNFTFIEVGTVNAATGWVLQGDGVLTLNSSNLSWAKFSATATVYTAGNGLTLSGNQFSVNLASSSGLQFTGGALDHLLDGSTLSKSASGLKVATGGITNTEVSSSAAIARSKLASGTANAVVFNDGSGVMTDDSSLTYSTSTGVLALSSAVAAAGLKFTGIGASQSSLTLRQSNGTLGTPTATASADVIAKMGFSGYGTAYVEAASIKAVADETFTGSVNGAHLELYATKATTNSLVPAHFVFADKQRTFDTSSSNYVETRYVHSTTLTGSTSSLTTFFTIATSSFAGLLIDYTMHEATSGLIRTGRMIVAQDGTTSSLTDANTESGALSVTLDSAISAGNLNLQYTNTSANNVTLRMNLKLLQ